MRERINWLNSLGARIIAIQEAIGRLELRQLQALNRNGLEKNEFKVYSQWGEDGIIQYLLRHIIVDEEIFVEFGVENYTESNTRFLLTNNNWRGLVIDGSEENIAYIKNDPIYWRHNLKAECAFIDSDNINDIIKKNGIGGDIGLLSVDIDGNDYWVWSAIDCIAPRIVVCEYNSLFGALAEVTVPYEKKFIRNEAHYSNIYYGASISALTSLARTKGYSLVGSNNSGNNVFFVRNDLLNGLDLLKPEEAYVKAQFRESRDETGKLSFLDFDQRLELINELFVYDLVNEKNIKIKDLNI